MRTEAVPSSRRVRTSQFPAKRDFKTIAVACSAVHSTFVYSATPIL